MWRGAGTGCSRASSQLVADVAQQGPAIRLVALVLNAERRLAIDHAEDTTTLLGLGNQDLDRVRRRTVDAARLRDPLDLVEHVHGKTLAQEHDERAVSYTHL